VFLSRRKIPKLSVLRGKVGWMGVDMDVAQPTRALSGAGSVSVFCLVHPGFAYVSCSGSPSDNLPLVSLCSGWVNQFGREIVEY
jgi:hypothetical protein